MEKILFIPDCNLGGYIAKQVPKKEIKLINGGCPAHAKMTKKDVEAAKAAHPGALFLKLCQHINVQLLRHGAASIAIRQQNTLFGGQYLASFRHKAYAVTEGSLCPVSCLRQEGAVCPRSADCMTLPVWDGLYKVINEYLDGVTLRDILDQSLAGNNFSI